MTITASLIPLMIVGGLIFAVTPWVSPSSSLMRHCFFFAFCFWQAQYFLWRVRSTIPEPAFTVEFVYAALFFAIELILFRLSYRTQRGLLRTQSRSEEADLNEGWFLSLPEPPLIDLLIPTYNEPWEILEKTIVGACGQDYPRVRIWVLDDGRRPWLAAKSARLGVGYLTRDNNRSAKAGNLNNALVHLDNLANRPDFIAVLDADFIPRPRFCSRAMALMYAPERGIVQTPQYHLNPDPFQSAFRSWRAWPDTQRFVFKVALPAQDASGGAYCCGTSFVARMEALRAIGGFPTESVTEDMLTTIKMRLRGWQTVFLGELLSTGLAPEGIREYLTQRGRWALGSVQIGWWCSEQGRMCRGVWGRWGAMEPLLRWGYSSLLRLVIMMIPLIYWVGGFAPYEAEAWQVFWFSFPAILLQRGFMAWVSAGCQLPVISQANLLLSTFAVVPATLKGLVNRTNHRFVVTDKGVNHSGRTVHWGTLSWLIGYGAILCGAMAYRLTRAGGSGLQGTFKYVTIAWTVSNALVLLVAALACLEAPRRRGEFRYPVGCPSRIRSAGRVVPAQLLDLSVSGAFVQVRDGNLAVNETVTVALEGVGWVEARVVRRESRARFGLVFSTTDGQRHALIREIFCSPRYVKPADEGSAAAAIAGIVRRIFE